MATVWDRTAEFLGDNIATVLPIALLAFFVPASIEGNFEAAMRGASFELVLTLRLVQLAFGILSLWGTLAVTAMALDIAGSDHAGTLAGRRLPAALAVSVAMIAAMLVLALPVPLVLSASGADLSVVARGGQIEMSGGVATFVALYGLGLMLVLIWLAARLVVTTPVIVREKRVFSAIPQSWRLTRGAGLRIVGVILLFALVSWVSQLAAQTVFGSIFTLVAGPEEGVSLAGVLTSIVVAAVQTGFTLLIPAFTAKLYLALTAAAGLRESASAA